MLKIFCDRCGAQGFGPRSLWDRAQTMNNGDYMLELYIVEDGDSKDKNKDYVIRDLCDNCRKELEQLIITFMSNK